MQLLLTTSLTIISWGRRFFGGEERGNIVGNYCTVNTVYINDFYVGYCPKKVCKLHF